jgi:hypothetical protein
VSKKSRVISANRRNLSCRLTPHNRLTVVSGALAGSFTGARELAGAKVRVRRVFAIVIGVLAIENI